MWSERLIQFSRDASCAIIIDTICAVGSEQANDLSWTQPPRCRLTVELIICRRRCINMAERRIKSTVNSWVMILHAAVQCWILHELQQICFATTTEL